MSHSELKDYLDWIPRLIARDRFLVKWQTYHKVWKSPSLGGKDCVF